MNIEQKLAFIQRALELGAKIEVKWHFIENEEKAKELIANFEDDTVPFQCWNVKKTNWYGAYDDENGLSTTVFFQKEYLEEDVDLSGMSSEETA